MILGDDSEFWQSCANYCTVVKAAMVALGEFDRMQPRMGNNYMILRALHHHMAALYNAPFNMPSDLVEPLELALRNREALHASDLYYTGALFNPHLIKDMELRDDKNAMAGLMKVFQKLTNTTEEFHTVKAEFNMYFQTMSPYYGKHVWSSTGVKEVPHLWWFTSGSVEKMLPCIAQRILAQVVSLSSYEQNWSNYSFVHNKAQNRLLPSCAEDLVYVYTNSRVLNQNMPSMDGAATKWYMQTIVSEDSDSKGPVDLFDDYDDVPYFDTPNISADNENTQGRREEEDGLQQQPREIEEDGRDLLDWAARNINRPHIEPPREHEQSLPPANSNGGDASLRTNPILHGREGVDNEGQDPNDELQDSGTSPIILGDTMASEERPMHDNDVPPINPVSHSCNELIVQGIDGGGPVHCMLLPSGIDGIDMEGNAPVPTLENISMLNAAAVGIQEDANHPMPPSQPQQLFRTLADVPRTPMCIPPSMHPILIGLDPSLHIPASNTLESDDEVPLCF